MNPLDETDIEILEVVAQRADEIAAYCEDCTACSLDVRKDARKCQEQKTIAQAIARTFGPGSPSWEAARKIKPSDPIQ